MVKKNSKGKAVIPGGLADITLGNVSTEVQVSQTPMKKDTDDSRNPFISNPSTNPEPDPPFNPEEGTSSSPKPSAETNNTRSKDSVLDRVNIGEAARAILESKGITHWKSSYLTPINGPLTDLERKDESFSDASINLIACRPLTALGRMGNDAGQLIGRVLRAIELGTAYLGRKVKRTEEKSSHLTRNEERLIFKPVLKTLNELLKEVVRYDDTKRVGYSLERETFEKLEDMLKDLRREALDNILSNNEDVPKLPLWGRNDDIESFWTENDFEILGSCYRTEVEQFLTYLTRFHRFENAKESRVNDKKHVEFEEGERMVQEPDRKSTEEIQPQVNRTQQLIDEERRKFEHDQGYSNESISQAPRQNQLTKGRTWGNKKLTVSTGNPSDKINSRRMKEMFGENDESQETSQGPSLDNASASRLASTIDRPDKRQNRKGNSNSINAKSGSPDDGPSDDDDDEDKRKKEDKTPRVPRSGWQDNSMNHNHTTSLPLEPQFDNRLKPEIIPTWDGNIDTLGRWVLKINRLAQRSGMIFEQLGYLVPSRLTGSAETWYYSQSMETRISIERNWKTLRSAIGAYYMNRSYMDKQKTRANRATYRDTENPKETPSEYFIRKVEMLDLVYDYSDSELINEIMAGAPSHWMSILTPHLYDNLDEFNLTVKFHEDTLLKLDGNKWRSNTGSPFRDSISRNPFNNYRNIRTNLVGWSKDTLNPRFPKDDTNISPKATPEEKGARPCRHCGSGKHWDPECKYARKGEKRARVNAVTISEESQSAQEEYESLYYECISDSDAEEPGF